MKLRPQIRLRPTEDLELIQALDRPLLGGSMGAILSESHWWLAQAFINDEWAPVGYCGIQPSDEGRYGFLSRAGVLAIARGHGLQKRMIRVRERWARAHGMTHTYTYVAWNNISSMRSLVASGYKPYTHRTYGDLRALYFRRLL
jgi:GNAT superfamily N-acetyltransferase